MIEALKSESAMLGFSLLVDGQQIELGSLMHVEDRFSPHLHRGQLTDRFLAHSFNELPDILAGAEIETKIEIDHSIFVLRVDIEKPNDSNEWLIKFGFAFDAENWKLPFTITDYATELISVVDEFDDPYIYSTHFEKEEQDEGYTLEYDYMMRVTNIMRGDRVGVVLKVPSPEIQISTGIEHLRRRAKEINEIVKESLISKLYCNSVVIYLDGLPEEVRVPCEQYLAYFVQFLRDLGIKATSELRYEAGQVLFAVTPEDSRVALDNIRSALDLYLRFPSSPINDNTYESIEVQRLEANILRLRSDLKLAAAELQTKNATIQTQQLMIDVQKSLLSGEIIFDTLKGVTPKRKDKDKEEEFLGGMLSLIPVEGKGVKINLPEIFRRLRGLFQ